MLSIYWFWVWRSTVGSVLIYAAVFLILYLVFGIIFAQVKPGTSALDQYLLIRKVTPLAAFPFGILWGIKVMKMIFKKRFRDFRIVVVESYPALSDTDL
jgi:hypothetical protein